MQQQKEILHLIKKYEVLFPAETSKIMEFKKFVSENRNENLYIRKNFLGHITTSGAIINQKGSHILLLKHKQLNKWLLPGGHIEPEDKTILEGTYREIKEETNIDISQLIPLSFHTSPIPIEMDSHSIPDNFQKQEPAHFHHDFRYAFLYVGKEEEIQFDDTESTAIKWIKISELISDKIFMSIVPKIKNLLNLNSSILNKK